MSEWIDRNSEQRPDDGQQVIVAVRCQNRANNFTDVNRYDAGRDLFTSDGYAQKVAWWMPIPQSGRVTVNWEQWRVSFEERKGR